MWPTSQGMYLMGLSYINQYCSPNAHPFNGSFSRTTQVSQYQKGKTNLDFTEARDSERGSGISWAICKSAPRSRQITMPAPHHCFYRPKCTFIRQGHETDRQTDVRQQCLLPSPILYKWGTIQLPQTNGQCSALTYCSICNRRTSMKGTMKSCSCYDITYLSLDTRYHTGVNSHITAQNRASLMLILELLFITEGVLNCPFFGSRRH